MKKQDQPYRNKRKIISKEALLSVFRICSEKEIMQVQSKFIGGMLEAKNWIEFTPL